MTIEGECLGEPATVEVDGDRVIWSYYPAPGHAAASGTARLDELAIELRGARVRGLEPFHAFAIVFAVGAYFARMRGLAVAFAAAGIGHAIYRLARPPQVLVLATAAERFEIVVARGSIEQARELVRQRAAR